MTVEVASPPGSLPGSPSISPRSSNPAAPMQKPVLDVPPVELMEFGQFREFYGEFRDVVIVEGDAAAPPIRVLSNNKVFATTLIEQDGRVRPRRLICVPL